MQKVYFSHWDTSETSFWWHHCMTHTQYLCILMTSLHDSHPIPVHFDDIIAWLTPNTCAFWWHHCMTHTQYCAFWWHHCMTHTQYLCSVRTATAAGWLEQYLAAKRRSSDTALQKQWPSLRSASTSLKEKDTKLSIEEQSTRLETLMTHSG